MSYLLLFLGIESYRASVLALLQYCLVSFEHGNHHLSILVASGSRFLLLGELRLDSLQVLELQLSVDDALVL